MRANFMRMNVMVKQQLDAMKMRLPRIAVQRGALMALLLGTLFCAQQSANAADVLRVGTTPSSPPNAFLDVKTKTIQGLMPDVIREIAKRENLEITFEPMPFSALVQSVVSGKIDMIVAGMKNTPRRAEIVDFANPIYSFGEAMVLPDSDQTDYKVAADMKGKRIGLPSGTTYAEAISKIGGFKEIKYYESAAEGVADVTHGRIDTLFQDAPIMGWMSEHGDLPGLHLAPHYTPIEVGGIAIAVKKGNKPLLDKINAGVASMKSDGTMDQLLAKWHLK